MALSYETKLWIDKYLKESDIFCAGLAGLALAVKELIEERDLLIDFISSDGEAKIELMGIGPPIVVMDLSAEADVPQTYKAYRIRSLEK